MRRVRSALVLLALLLAAAVAVWWTVPAGWLPQASAERERRVVPPRPPAWTRRAITDGPGIRLPPISPQGERRAQIEPDDEPEGLDTGSASFGPATLSGWIVDVEGTNVGNGVVQARCTLRDPETGETAPGRAGVLYLRTDRDGFFEGDVTGPAICVLVGRRRDGLLFAQSQPRELWVEPGELLELDLVVPAQRTGGIGVGIQEHPDGIAVVQVHEGTPAWEAGLEHGDVIVAVDGRPVQGYDLDTFIGEMTGPEGSDVTFTVKGANGVLTTHTARRAYLDRSLIR